MASYRAALLQVLLVVFLSAPEGLRRHYLGHNRFFEGSLLRQPGNRSVGSFFLLGRMEKYHAAVLCSPVRTLTVQLGGIMQLEKQVQEPLVAYSCLIELYFHDFCVPGSICTYVFVGGVVEFAAFVTYRRLNHPRQLLEASFNSPEASCAKCCFLHKSSLMNTERMV